MTPEEYIKAYTRGNSNELVHGGYHEWLTPENALAAVELAREEIKRNAVGELETGALLDKALELIVELCKDDDNICCALHEIPEENNYCAEHCDNFNKSCVLRYLKYNNKITKENGRSGKEL